MATRDEIRFNTAKYERKRRENGDVRVAVWVPLERKQELISYANNLRCKDTRKTEKAVTSREMVYLKLTKAEREEWQEALKHFDAVYVKKSANYRKSKTWKVQRIVAEKFGLSHAIKLIEVEEL